MPAGRPLKYKTPEEMQIVIDRYFAECEKTERPLTISGLAYALDMSRQAICDYSEKSKFLDTIKKAKLKVESSIESGLMKGYNATGCIFNLKNNFGWKDKTEVDLSSADGSMTPPTVIRLLVPGEK